ncbi:MAG: acetyltransferase [Flavobacteriaceae bacterium]|nr:MAG: acetyltransferase [Flavobacteriaceae bacterium]
MLVIGAKGFAKEVLQDLFLLNDTDALCFYDDISNPSNHKLFDKFPIIHSEEEAKNYFTSSENRFTIGIGSPELRKKMADKFQAIGGQLTSVISEMATIGSFGVTIGKGSNLMAGSIVSNDVTIGQGSLIYFNAIITHDVSIGDFVELSPGATILGRSNIGNFSQIGSNATVLPDIEIGSNVIVAAGAVVTQNVPDNCMVAGIPAVIKKEITPLTI